MFLVIIALPLHAAISDGLILDFSFDEASGDTVMDMTNGGHDGVLKEGAAIINDVVMIGGLVSGSILGL